MRLIFDYIESMIRADRFLPPPPELAVFTFDFYDWRVRPRQPEAIAPLAAVNPHLIAFLSHAGTDLMTLGRARPDLPGAIRVLGLPLLSIVSDEQMLATLNVSSLKPPSFCCEFTAPWKRFPHLNYCANAAVIAAKDCWL